MYNKVVLVGRLTKDIDLKYVPNGTAVSKSSIATSHKFKDKATGNQKEEVCFIDITLFGRSAEVANQYLKKGSLVLIEGRLILNQWVDSSGQKRSKHEVAVEKLTMLGKKDKEDYPTPNPKEAEQTQQYSSDVSIEEDEIPF